MNETPVVYVDLKQSKRKWPLNRPQRWYWVALNGNNMRRMARSSEMYTNEADVLSAAQQLFGDGANVYLRHPEKGNAVLRMAVEQ